MAQQYIVEGKRVPELLILNQAVPNTWIPIYQPSTDTTKRISLQSIISFLNLSITSNSFTEQEVRDTDLAGLVFTDGTPITNVDTVIIALGKLQQQINILTLMLSGSEKGISAFNAGGQASATQLTMRTNRVDFCATDFGSIKTFAALDNLEIYIQNLTSKKVHVFPILNERFRDGLLLLPINIPLVIPPRNNLTLYCYFNENGIFTRK